MEYPIIFEGNTVGNCTLEQDGLYWQLQADCAPVSDRVERLYCGPDRLGVLLREGERFVLRRRVSRAAHPELPPVNGIFTLKPTETPVPWQGCILGIEQSGYRAGETLLFPYDEEKPCPCEPLFCFFEIKDGFWRLNLSDIEHAAAASP